MEKTYFDGVSFESKGIVVERIHDPLPDMREEMTAYQGRHGSRATSLTLGPRDITLECRAILPKWSDFDELMDDVTEWFVTEDDRKLILRSHPKQAYMAHYKSMAEGEREGGTGIGAFEVTFCASDPIRFGEARSLVVSTDSKQVEVGGTEEADLKIAVRNASPSGGLFAISVDGNVMKVALDRGGSAIDFDCLARRVTINGNASSLTLDSDWPDLTPGRKTIRITIGSGTATLSWTQRYR